jgi:hypothetical protein
MTQERAVEESKLRTQKPERTQPPEKQHADGTAPAAPGLLRLQRQVGNQAVQRLISQRSADGSFDLDDTTADRINRARGSGHPLDGVVQKEMSQSMGHDFGGVRVHTSPEADGLNHELSAKAFTTGQDVFFRQGAYDPGSGSGRELISHELSHVVQQSAGLVGGRGGRMTVRPADDAYEREADSIASTTANTEAPVQRQEDVPEEELQTQAIQRQEEVPEEELQTQAIQRQEELPEEEL